MLLNLALSWKVKFCNIFFFLTIVETEKPLNLYCFVLQVIVSAGIVYIVFGGSIRVGLGAQTSSQPCRLVPLANGLSQLSMTLSLFAIAIILPMIAKLR